MSESRRPPYRNGYYERDFVTRLGTIGVQQKLMRHADIRTAIYGDTASADMRQAHSKIVQLAMQTAGGTRNLLKNWLLR